MTHIAVRLHASRVILHGMGVGECVDLWNLSPPPLPLLQEPQSQWVVIPAVWPLTGPFWTLLAESEPSISSLSLFYAVDEPSFPLLFALGQQPSQPA